MKRLLRKAASLLCLFIGVYVFYIAISGVVQTSRYIEVTGILQAFECQEHRRGDRYKIALRNYDGDLSTIVSGGVSCAKLGLLSSSDKHEIRVKYEPSTGSIRYLEASGEVLISETESSMGLLGGAVIWGGLMLYIGIILWRDNR